MKNKSSVSQNRLINQTTMTTAIENGFSHTIRTKDEYLFFRSQSAMKRRLNKIEGNPVYGEMTIYNLCWLD